MTRTVPSAATATDCPCEPTLPLAPLARCAHAKYEESGFSAATNTSLDPVEVSAIESSARALRGKYAVPLRNPVTRTVPSAATATDSPSTLPVPPACCAASQYSADAVEETPTPGAAPT